MSTPANSLNITSAGLVKFDGTNTFAAVTTTQHDVLVGGASNGITSVSPSTSGLVLTSNGVSADPSFQSVSAAGAITTITGNSGGAESPSAGNFNILGTGSITVAGTANTETVQMTGLTNHNVLVGAGTATITNVAPSVTSGVPLISQGSSADPAFGTAVVAGGGTGAITLTGVLTGNGTSAVTANTVTQHGVLIGGASNAVSSLGVASTGTVLAGNTGADPSFQSLSTLGGITTITGNSGGAEVPSAGNFNVLGTGSITVAGSANTETVQLTGLTNHAVLVGAGTATITNVGPTATAGQVLQSAGSLADPSFSTATYPSTATSTGTILRADGTNWSATTATYPNTTTSQQLLYSSAANTVSGLATGNSLLAATNSSGTLAMRAFSVVIQTFTSNGTYTPTSGMLYCVVEALGGGGAGGGAAATFSGGSGGGAGEYAKGVFSAATIGASQSVTIGAGGTGVSGTTGNPGGNTSLGALISANGGSGGLESATNTQGGAGGTGGSGGSFRTPGSAGGSYVGVTGTFLMAGNGGNSQYGSGGIGTVGTTADGNAGLGYGSGGGGAGDASTTAKTGGAGKAGIVIVTEYVIA